MTSNKIRKLTKVTYPSTLPHPVIVSIYFPSLMGGDTSIRCRGIESAIIIMATMTNKNRAPKNPSI